MKPVAKAPTSPLQIFRAAGCSRGLEQRQFAAGQPQQLSLRGLQARLVLRQLNSEQLAITNAVNLGPFQLRFEGAGTLQGSRPLLQFSFDKVVLLAWSRRWIERSLPQPAPSRLPFFALIHRDPTGWLAARGRGGGLAFWTLHPEEEDGRQSDQT